LAKEILAGISGGVVDRLVETKVSQHLSIDETDCAYSSLSLHLILLGNYGFFSGGLNLQWYQGLDFIDAQRLKHEAQQHGEYSLQRYY
jgi:hypothetical protein